jgi:hypothetical protein
MARPIHANLEMPVAPVLARAPLKIEGERGGVGAFPRLPPFIRAGGGAGGKQDDAEGQTKIFHLKTQFLFRVSAARKLVPRGSWLRRVPNPHK